MCTSLHNPFEALGIRPSYYFRVHTRPQAAGQRCNNAQRSPTTFFFRIHANAGQLKEGSLVVGQRRITDGLFDRFPEAGTDLNVVLDGTRGEARLGSLATHPALPILTRTPS